MLYAPAFAALLGGTIYFLLIAKLQTFGPITLLGLMMGGFSSLVVTFLPRCFPALFSV